MAIAGSSERLQGAIDAIVDGYARGTRFGIRMDDDGLLACGEPGVQLTWMDARVDGHVITPRIGKPVEVQALWINALHLAGRTAFAQRASAALRARFVDPEGGGLHDVVDADHVAGRIDASVRPNQLFAAGGLPFAVVEGELARKVVETVERELVTPAGVRSLARSDPAYCARYEGGPAQRDGAYHQGTAWPWLIGPFVDAWLRVHGTTRRRRRKRGNVSSRRSRRALEPRASITCSRSPTATRRIRRADARSRRGRSASSSARRR